MKKKWIYGAILAILILGLIYLLWNRNTDRLENTNSEEDRVTVEDDPKLED